MRSALTPTVSICLPVYNGERHLPEAIESVLAQSFEDFELIVNDDLSSDTSREIATRYAQQDSRVKVLTNQERLGLFQNYNAAISRAQGQIIKPFAQDDRLYEDCLSSLVDLLECHPQATLATVNRNWIDDDGGCVSHKYRTPSVSDYFGESELIDGTAVIDRSLVPVVNMIGEPVCVAFRREHCGLGFDPEFHHLGDLDFWLRLLKRGQLAYLPEVLASYRRHQTAQTELNRTEMRIVSDVLRLKRKFAAALTTGESNDRFMPEAIKLIAGDLYNLAQEAIEHQLSNSRVDPEDLIFAGARDSISRIGRGDLEEICVDSLRLVGELLHGRGNEWGWSRHGQRHVEYLEKRLSAMLNDPLWRIARPAREVRKLLACEVSTDEIGGAQSNASSLTAVAAKPSTQSEYLRYLRNQISTIRRSRTWRMRQRMRQTPLRVLLPNKVIETEAACDDVFVPLRMKEGHSVRVSHFQPLKDIEEVLWDYLVSGDKKPRNARSRETIEASCEATIRTENASQTRRISVLLTQEAEVSESLVASLNNQTLDRSAFEVIFINSSSASSKTGGGNIGALPLRAFRNRAGGRAYANNFAARMACGDILIFLASDFVPGPDFLKRHLEFHDRKSNQMKVAIGGNSFLPELLKDEFRKWLDDSGTLFGICFNGKHVTVPETFFYVGNSSIRKSIFMSAGLFDEDFPGDAWEDFEFSQRLEKMRVRATYLPGASCMHDHHVVLAERLRKMKDAAEGALLMERKYNGTFPWKALTKESSRELLSETARMLLVYCLTRNENARSAFYKNACETAFSLAHRHLSRKH